MTFDNLHERSGTEIASLVAAGEVTVPDVASATLDHIQFREPSLHAWEFLDGDLVVAQAMATGRKGPLAGVAVAVKDNFDTFDMPTTYGSPIYSGNRPLRDALSVARLRQAGALIVGKTTMTQFAAVYEPARTVNPYLSSRTPGGSSSGSAAAVADRMVPVAVGTQTAGSVIRPAAYCGIFGFKPTMGSIERAGVKLISPTLDTIGIFARCVDDLVLLSTVLFDPLNGSTANNAASKERNTVTAPARLRVAYVPTSRWDQAEPATKLAVETAARLIARDGAQVTEVRLPDSFDDLIDASEVIFHLELSRMLRTEYQLHRDMLLPSLIEAIEDGLGTDEGDYNACLETASRCRVMLKALFADHDVILTAATIGEAPPIASTGDPLFCRSWSLLGNPTATVPGLRGASGLPLGIQLVGEIGSDARLLSIVDQVAQSLPVLPAPSGNRMDVSDKEPAPREV
ncbi:MAG TPA: amidase [Candidatus Micrarchaeaceae archaeon]|nr:amidase [Candidatus Micrarchaeaceae archaeon]